MSLLDWWTSRASRGKPSSAPSKRVTELADSMFVAVEADGVWTVIDHDSYDYQQGVGNLLDPAQRDLDELTITRIRALSGGMFRGQAVGSAVLLDTSEASTIATFRRCCAIVEGPGGGHCGCLGGPTLELFAGSEHVATIGIHHGHKIRWSRWRDDARLRDREGLTNWLTAQGIEPTLLELLYKNPLPHTGGRVDGWGTDALSLIEQRVLLAEIRFRQNDIDVAIADCDALLVDHPDTARAYALRGALRRTRAEWAASAADYTDAIERGYRTADTLSARAVAFDGLGQTIAALEDCTQAIALDPAHADAYNSRAIIHMRLGRRRETLADLAKAIELAPDWALPYMNRAGYAQINSDPKAAIADYTHAIRLIEKRKRQDDLRLLARLYWNRSEARDDEGDKRGANADRREAERLDPKLGST